MSQPNLYDTCLLKGYIEHDELLQCVTAEFQQTQEILISTTNVFFLIYAASLVFFMQTGFAMICSGCVRKNNVQNTMLKNLLDVCGSALAYFSVGCKCFRSTEMLLSSGQGLADWICFCSHSFITDAFSFGDDRDGKTFIGNKNFFLTDMGDDTTGGSYSIWLFHFAFAATSGTFLSFTKNQNWSSFVPMLFSHAKQYCVLYNVCHVVCSNNCSRHSSRTVSNESLSIV